MRKPFFLLFTFTFASLTASETPPLPRLHICTVASQETTGLKQLKHSCEHYNIHLEVLGLGQPYTGNGKKLIHLKNYLASIPDEDLVLFVDAYDVLILANKQTIIEKFLALNNPCIISAETNLHPYNKGFLRRYPKSPTKFRFLNAGSIMGYSCSLKHILNSMPPIIENQSDQKQITAYYLDHQSEILLDNQCDLFLTLCKISEEEIQIDKSRKVVHSLTTNTTPILIHGNGPGKPLYQKIYNELFGKVEETTNRNKKKH
jgi:hypothetical protein